MNKEKFETVWKCFKKDIIGTKFANHVYFVGGCVRDFLMGNEINDIDIAVDLPNGGLEFAKWYTSKYKVFSETNPITYGRAKTSKFTIDTNDELKGIKFEATQTLLNPLYSIKEAEYSENVGSISDDAMNRDLTINAIYVDITCGELLDPLQGIDDITEKILTTTNNPDVIFKDDPLRMLRIIRFASKYGFNIDKRTWFGIIKNCDKINNVTPERVRCEFENILMTDKPSLGLNRLLNSGLLYEMMPQMYFMSHAGIECRTIAPNQWEHTLDVVDKTKPILLNRLYAFFHDIGKASTFKIKNGKATYVGHEGSGQVYAENIMKKFYFSKPITDKVKNMIKHHMDFSNVVYPYTPSPKTIRKFISEFPDDLENVLDVMKCDYESHSHSKLLHFNCIEEKIEEVKIEMAKNEKNDFKLPINGNEIMEACHVKGGPIMSSIIDVLKDKMLENPNLTKDEAIEIAKLFVLSLVV